MAKSNYKIGFWEAEIPGTKRTGNFGNCIRAIISCGKMKMRVMAKKQ